MEKGSSFLFAGTNFNKEKFATDFARFKEKKKNVHTTNELSMFEIEKSEVVEVPVPVRKRKRKPTVSEMVEGFNVFKSSKKLQTAVNKDGDAHHIEENPKKELYRQIERDALFRKKYNIHVSGNNVPSPLQGFADLSLRFGCEAYILHNWLNLDLKSQHQSKGRLFRFSYLAGNALLVLQLDLAKPSPFSVPCL